MWNLVCFHISAEDLFRVFITAAIPLVITGGFHVDGFMDTMDALCSNQGRERKLEILKDPHTGAFACIFLVCEMTLYGAALYLGRTYEALGDYNYASSIYAAFTENDQSRAEIYNQLGLCRMQMKEYTAALEAFQAAMNIEDNGMMQSLKFNEIVAYEYMGDFKTASALMNSYMKSYPDDETAKREYEFLRTR